MNSLHYHRWILLRYLQKALHQSTWFPPASPPRTEWQQLQISPLPGIWSSQQPFCWKSMVGPRSAGEHHSWVVIWTNISLGKIQHSLLQLSGFATEATLHLIQEKNFVTRAIVLIVSDPSIFVALSKSVLVLLQVCKRTPGTRIYFWHGINEVNSYQLLTHGRRHERGLSLLKPGGRAG